MFLTRRLRPLVVTIVALFALVGVTGAAASPSTSASGTFTYTSCVTDNTQEIGNKTVLNLTCNLSYTGTLSGSSILQGPLIISANGSTYFWGVEFFTGTVNGASGTATLFVTAPGNATSFQGSNRIVNGTGELANLHGVVRTAGTVPPPPGLPSGTYTGQIVFDQP